MDYNKIYNDLIDRARNRDLTGYTEKHHIIPKCIGGNDESTNLIALTAREHFLAHKLLCEIHPTKVKLYYALWLMAIGKQTWKGKNPYGITSRDYERIKLAFIKKAKQKRLSPQTKKLISKKNSKKVIQYDFKGNLLNRFSSANDGERFITNKPEAHWKDLKSNIDACCRLKQKSAYGFIWKYEGDLLHLTEHKGSLNKKNGSKINRKK